MRYFISDFHFGHESIVSWERTQFSSIEEHDNYIEECLIKWSKRLTENDELWILGDWGRTDNLDIMDCFKARTVYVYGNHDSEQDYNLFLTHFDEVHRYPVYISNRIAVSHIPLNVWDSQVNVHGHFHGSVMDDPHYVTCSINDVNYQLVSEKQICGALSKVSSYDMRFLYEPFADMYRYTNPAQLDRSDVIFDKDGRVDVAASRALRKLKENE